MQAFLTNVAIDRRTVSDVPITSVTLPTDNLLEQVQEQMDVKPAADRYR